MLKVAARQLDPGMGFAVAKRTVLRKLDPVTRATLPPNTPDSVSFVWETWDEVADRVAQGNCLLAKTSEQEHLALRNAIATGALITSGRHLQHGDVTQPTRNMEVFTNCLGGSTRILTMEYGPIEIEKIAGQVVTVVAGDGMLRPARINAHGEQDLFEITFKANSTGAGHFRRTVLATANHRWVLNDESVTDTLKVGDVIRHIHTGVERDPVAVVHGLIFGDGAAHKGRRDNGRPGISQGRTYASIRVCKEDAVRDEIHRILDAAGYKFSTPPHASGDRVYYIGKFEHAKDLPFAYDPAYVAGFIYGWWLADGSKGVDHALEISTADGKAAGWLNEYAGYAGLNVTMHRLMARSEGDGSFPNGKALHIMRLREGMEWKVEKIEPLCREVVYCPEEPVTSSFVLANGLLTGNCSTAAICSAKFYLLLNGSGVGRAYDDDKMVVDWGNAPGLTLALSKSHPDFPNTDAQLLRFGVEFEILPFGTKAETFTEELRERVIAFRDSVIDSSLLAFPRHDMEARYYDMIHSDVVAHRVGDSREGWAYALELYEAMAFLGLKHKSLILDFSAVRPCGAPIAGMQSRPASGPLSVMRAFMNVRKDVVARAAEMELWEQQNRVDHHFSVEVQVGGARRAARMSSKNYRDPGIFKFIRIKSEGGLWTSNNSVMVDEEFWEAVRRVQANYPHGGASEFDDRCFRIFNEVTACAYINGEPGFINGDRLEQYGERPIYADGSDFRSHKYQSRYAFELLKEVAERAARSLFKHTTNPCGEISLHACGAYCVIADAAPLLACPVDFLAPDFKMTKEIARIWDEKVEESIRLGVRFLMRVNMMDALYGREVKRTNRIGISLTGIHEWAWARFSLGFRELIDEKVGRDFWETLFRFSRAAKQEAVRYAEELGVEIPHTVTTIKPAGTTSKLYGLSEGAHLPAMRQYLRWVQFKGQKNADGTWPADADGLLAEYEAKGYPIRALETFKGMSIVGFPTVPLIAKLGMGDFLVTAPEATPEEQYQYLRLLEKYWLGVEFGRANQVSYTLKVYTDKHDLEAFRDIVLEHQPTVRCCSIMPQKPDKKLGYEYLPEEEVPIYLFAEIVAGINDPDLKQEIDLEHLKCASGACPI